MHNTSQKRVNRSNRSRSKIRRLDQHSFLEGCDFGLELCVVREDESQEEDSELFDDDNGSLINLNNLGAGR